MTLIIVEQENAETGERAAHSERTNTYTSFDTRLGERPAGVRDHVV